MAPRPQPSFSGDDSCPLTCLTWCYGKLSQRASRSWGLGRGGQHRSPSFSRATACSHQWVLFVQTSLQVWLWYHCRFLRLVENPHLTRQELSLIDKEVWCLHQPCKTLPSLPRCSGGWEFLMKVSIHKPEAVSVGTPGPGSDPAVQKYCRAWSWGQNQWIESKLYYLWVMIPCQCVRNVVLCVWKRERDWF